MSTFQAGDVVRWTEVAHDLHTHHHHRRHHHSNVELATLTEDELEVLPHDPGGARPQPLTERQRKGRRIHRLTVVRGLQDGTVLVRHPDGSEQEVHPTMIARTG